ncbi:hypothetical protein M3M39_06195 [Fructilactobacillus hinvesii]|uniref:DUF3784 domain-containing protein n=1 Tax=Fructilactobacillus hinvesii TaxID=2940300 RepID=A0ABY5BRG2_9LACO|nr:hypothetical protein [Fructilactobacillus hinvesii]USS87697.1 hypothetical protein M3M39_06195 [Fructilactobacillus hinvesii]
MINLLALLFALLLAGNGLYFLFHQHRPFLLFHPEQNSKLQTILRVSGICLLLLALLTLGAVLLNNIPLLVIALIGGCLGCLIPELLLIPYMNH